MIDEKNVRRFEILYLLKDVLADIQNRILNGNLEAQQIINGTKLIEYFDQINFGLMKITYEKNFIEEKINSIERYYNDKNLEAANEITELLFIIIDGMCNALEQKKELSVINLRNQNIYIKQIMNKYKDSTDEEVLEVIRYINKNKAISIFNYDFSQERKYKIECYFDDEYKMPYVIYKDKRMYFKENMSVEEIQYYFHFITVEQHENSPHRYFTDDVNVKEGDIVIDAGVAEGNFALDIIDKVKKLYIIECEQEWVKALRLTFKDYQDKVVIIDKMLGNINDDSHTTIDEFCQGENINFVKMDIEGSEIDALKGARKTLMNSHDCKCVICTYHRRDDETLVTEKLKQYGFDVHPSKGYMYFFLDEDSYVYSELRRGLVRGVK